MADTILHPEHGLIRLSSACVGMLVERLPIFRGLHRRIRDRLLYTLYPEIITMILAGEVDRYFSIHCQLSVIKSQT